MATIDDTEVDVVTVEAAAGIDAVLVDQQPRPPHRAWRLAGLVLAGGVLIGLATHAWLDARRDLERSERGLTAIDTELSATAARVGTERAGLDARLAELAKARRTLARRTAERDRSQAELEATRQELGERQSQLDSRQAELQQIARAAENLGACVLGASEALNSVSVGDLMGFARTIREIRDACEAAGAEL